jgi:hypothetical protein
MVALSLDNLGGCSMGAIELRSHHLGPIYDVVASTIVSGDPNDGFKDGITDFTNRIHAESYPTELIVETDAVLSNVFFRSCLVRIVGGLDQICKAGCIQYREEAASKYSHIEVGENAKQTMSRLCKNILAEEDQGMASIFGVRVGREYTSHHLISKARALYFKHRCLVWRELLDEYRCLYPDLSERFIVVAK